MGSSVRDDQLADCIECQSFIGTDRVTQQRHYHSFYSVFPLSLAALGAWLLFGLLNRLWYYPVFLFWDFMGAYFIVVRVWYWVNPSNAPLAD
jgi:hypothetical protein